MLRPALLFAFCAVWILPVAHTVAAQSAAPTAPDPPAIPAGMALIPGGENWMGTDDTDNTDNNQRDNTPLSANDARPRHRVKVGAFLLDKMPVTNAQYQKFCIATKIPPPPDWENGQFPPGHADFPVLHVNWYEAAAYANWVGKRLPTESEWERAARGEEDRLYPWGNDWDESKLVFDSGGPAPVGSKPGGATPEGLLDMAGNCFEWTSSWFEAYPNAPVKVPEFGQTFKVIRGGGWRGNGRQLASTWYRSANRPISRTQWVGFRCAKDVN